MSRSSSSIGRPSKITPEVVRKLEASFQWDLSVSEACALAGISRSTYYGYLRTHEEFSHKIARAQAYPIVLARQTVLQQIKAGDGRLALRFLERREPERYGLRLRHDPHTEPKKNIRIVMAGRYLDESMAS